MPALIRMSIFFTAAAPVLSDAKWVLFFDNVDFLGSTSDSAKPSCTNTQNTISADCKASSGLSASKFYQFKHWITFHTRTDSSMIDLDHSVTVMLPISTKSTLTTVQLRLALVDPSSSDLVIGFSHANIFTQPALSTAATLSDLNRFNYLSIMDFKITPKATALQVGSSPVTVPLSISVTDTSSTFLVGTTSVQAAGFTLASVHDFAANPLFNIVGSSLGISN